MTFRNANVPHVVLTVYIGLLKHIHRQQIFQWLEAWGTGCLLLTECLSKSRIFSEFFLILKFKLDFYAVFHDSKEVRSDLHILKNCLKWARVVLKEPNGRNQPEYSIVLLISYCQMERAALDNEEQWVFPSLSCLPATCLLSRALLLICYFNVPLTKTAREGEEEEEEEEIKEKKMLSLLMQSSSTHCHFADQPSFQSAL